MIRMTLGDKPLGIALGENKYLATFNSKECCLMWIAVLHGLCSDGMTRTRKLRQENCSLFL